MARVLVIDDEPDVLLLCRVNLGHAGHEVLEALDGDRGLELARGSVPDAIILDLMLPTMDGYAVLEALGDHETTRDIPVIVLTAKTQIEDRARSWRCGAAEFIAKPFSPQTLLDRLERITTMNESERRLHRDRAIRGLAQGG
jgi:two-component system phosphate regulon response regulator PhoB